MRRLPRFLLCWSLELFLILATLLAAAVTVWGATAPPTRPAKVVPPTPFSSQRLTGAWSIKWAGHPWHMVLSKDGSYRCTDTDGEVWFGRWQVDSGMLWVEERWVDGLEISSPCVWGVRWARDPGGKELPDGIVVNRDGSERTTISLTPSTSKKVGP